MGNIGIYLVFPTKNRKIIDISQTMTSLLTRNLTMDVHYRSHASDGVIVFTCLLVFIQLSTSRNIIVTILASTVF